MRATVTVKPSYPVLGHEDLTSRRLRKTTFRFPERALHVVDIENLAGAAIPSLALVSEVQLKYLACLRFGADDQVVLAASHLALLNAGLGWPHARYRVRSGKDGADLELIDVLEHENVATRFGHVVIGSGDGRFGGSAASLAARGVRVTVVSRRGSLSPGLARVARDVIYLDGPLTAAALAVYRNEVARPRSVVLAKPPCAWLPVYGRTAPSAPSAYHEVDSGMRSTSAPVCGASMM